MRKSYNVNDTAEKPVSDDLLATLLNPSGVIQIGSTVFQYNAEEQKVYVVGEENADLLSAKTKSANPDVLVFNEDDNVFDILDGKNTNELKASCPNKSYARDIPTGEGTAEAKVVYQSAGIYFSLIAQIKKNYYGGAAIITLNCPASTSFYYKKNSGEKNGLDINQLVEMVENILTDHIMV